MTIHPYPPAERLYPATISMMLEHDISALSHSADPNAHLSTDGAVTAGEDRVVLLMIAIADLGFLPRISGCGSRRLLAALVVELSMQREFDEKGARRQLDVLARFLRQELKELSRNPTSRRSWPERENLLDLIAWISEQPLETLRFPQDLKNAWASRLRAAAFEVATTERIARQQFEDAEKLGAEYGVYEVATIDGLPDGSIETFSLNQNVFDQKGGSRLISEINRDAEELGGTRLTNAGLTTASTLVMGAEECTACVDYLMGVARSAQTAGNTFRAHAATGRLLQLAVGAREAELQQLTWGDVRAATRAERPTLDTQFHFFFRHPLHLVADDGRQGAIWIPIPPRLQELLSQVLDAPADGNPVFPSIASSMAHIDGIVPSRLRRTFLSGLANTEPFGVSAAQLASTDLLGIDSAPLHYEKVEVHRLAALVAGVTFPWFGNTPRLLQSPPLGLHTGAGASVDLQAVKEVFESLQRKDVTEGDASVTSQVSHRTRNIVHGLVAATGHRPSAGLEKLTLEHFDLEAGLAVLIDKAVAPHWPHRPVALPPILCREIEQLLSELRSVAKLEQQPVWARAANEAVSGIGPLFMIFTPDGLARAFGRDDYMSNLTPELAARPNFGRHQLCQYLTDRVPETIRVAQMGWHGSREGAFADGSPYSVLGVCKILAPVLERYLGNIGWKPVGGETDDGVFPTDRLNWVRRKSEHLTCFHKSLYSLIKAHAQRESAAAKQCFPRLQLAFEHVIPGLQWTSMTTITKRTGDPDSESVEITRGSIEEVERLAGSGASVLERIAMRNLIHIVLRQARRKGVTKGSVPSRIFKRWIRQPGPFLSDAPRASRTVRQIFELMGEPGREFEPAVRCFLTVLLLGPYPDASLVIRMMASKCPLRRVEELDGSVLVEVAPGSSAYALGGISALAMWSWRRRRHEKMPSAGDLARLVYDALPEHMRPENAEATLSELEALASVHNAVAMDGVARLIGTGIANLSTANLEACAFQFGSPSAFRSPLGPPTSERTDNGQDTSGRAKKSAKAFDLCPNRTTALLHQALPESRPTRIGDEEARQTVISIFIEALETRGKEAPLSHQALARFALGLLQDGGLRKSHLQLITIHKYVSEAWRAMRRVAVGIDLSGELDVLYRVHALTESIQSPRVRVTYEIALRRVISVLGRYSLINLPPKYRMGPDERGLPPDVDVGVITDIEAAHVARSLETDVEALLQSNASPNEVHEAKARHLIFLLMQSTGLRPSEARRISFSDLVLARESFVFVRSSRWERLKTARSRRKVELSGQFVEELRSVSAAWEIDSGQRIPNRQQSGLPLFGSLGDPNRPIRAQRISERLGEILKVTTGCANAKPYWSRKAYVQHQLRDLVRSNPTSLWPVRALLARVGHKSLITTLEHYVHSPLVPLEGAFTEQMLPMSASTLANLTGVSRSTLSRKRGGRPLRSRRPERLLERMAAVTNGLSPVSTQRTTPPTMPNIVAAGTFDLNLEDIDRLLRTINQRSQFTSAARALCWPDAVAQALRHAVELLLHDYGISLLGSDETSQMRVPMPRPTEVPNVASFLGNVFDNGGKEQSHVVLEMAQSWVEHASLLRQHDGIPGTKEEWRRWESLIPEISSESWTSHQLGAFVLRSPPKLRLRTRSSWPLLRWTLLTVWIKAQVRHAMSPSPARDLDGVDKYVGIR